MIDKAAPDIELPGTGGLNFRLSAMRGGPVVLYFYPKDNTPGCTTEGQQFRDLHSKFQRLKCSVFGISRDSLRSHGSFKAKMDFPFELLSDADEIACKTFDVIRMKKMYGREVRGVERSTFVIDAKGIVRREWRAVKVPGHAEDVLAFVTTLAK